MDDHLDHIMEAIKTGDMDIVTDSFLVADSVRDLKSDRTGGNIIHHTIELYCNLFRGRELYLIDPKAQCIQPAFTERLFYKFTQYLHVDINDKNNKANGSLNTIQYCVMKMPIVNEMITEQSTSDYSEEEEYRTLKSKRRLHNLANECRLSILKTLLNTDFVDYHRRDNDGETLLTRAILHLDLEFTNQIVNSANKKGYDIRYYCNDQGLFPRELANGMSNTLFQGTFSGVNYRIDNEAKIRDIMLNYSFSNSYIDSFIDKMILTGSEYCSEDDVKLQARKYFNTLKMKRNEVREERAKDKHERFQTSLESLESPEFETSLDLSYGRMLQR